MSLSKRISMTKNLSNGGLMDLISWYPILNPTHRNGQKELLGSRPRISGNWLGFMPARKVPASFRGRILKIRQQMGHRTAGPLPSSKRLPVISITLEVGWWVPDFQ